MRRTLLKPAGDKRTERSDQSLLTRVLLQCFADNVALPCAFQVRRKDFLVKRECE
jgi:hypothetical protein